MYDVITIGSAARDLVIITRAGKLISTPQDPTAQEVLGFEYGAKIPVFKTYDNFGGGGCNVAVALSRLGIKVAARVNVGKDFEGVRIKKNLADDKVGTGLVSWDQTEKTDVSVVIIDQKKTGDHIIFVDKNASNNLTLGRKKLRARWFYISSLTGDWQKLFKEAICLADQKRINIAFNPGSLQLAAGYAGLKDILTKVQVLILSIDEAIELVLSKKRDAALGGEALSREIFSWGPKLVVITQGNSGALVYDGKVLREKAAVKVFSVIDTTGAGDAFSAGFLAAHILGRDLDTCLTWGVKNGAAAIREYGAQNGLLTRKEIEQG